MKKITNFLKNNYKFLLSYIFIFICSYILSSNSIWIADDYAFYNNIWNSGDNFSLARIFNRTNWFYLNWTGRYVSTFINYFLIYFDKIYFNILNAFANTYFVFILNKLTLNKHKFFPLIIYFLSWFIIPSYGQVMMWQIGSVIYLWMSCFGLTIIYLFLNTDKIKNTSKIKNIILIIALIIFSIISGNGFETNSVVIVSFMFIYMFKKIILEKRKIDKYKYIIFIGTFIGFCSNLFSPGNSVRIDSMSGTGDDFISKIFSGLGSWYYNGIVETRIFIIIPLCLILLMLYIYKNKKSINYLLTLTILSCGFIFSLIIFFIITYSDNINSFLIKYWNNMYLYDYIIIYIFGILLLLYGFIIYFKSKKIVNNENLLIFDRISLFLISGLIGVASYIVTPNAWNRSYMFMVIFFLIFILSLARLINKYKKINYLIFIFLFIMFECSYFNTCKDSIEAKKWNNQITNIIKEDIKSGEKIIYVPNYMTNNKHNAASTEKWVIPPLISDEMATENGIHKYYEWINIEVTNYYFNDEEAWNKGYRIISIES